MGRAHLRLAADSQGFSKCTTLPRATFVSVGEDVVGVDLGVSTRAALSTGERLSLTLAGPDLTRDARARSRYEPSGQLTPCSSVRGAFLRVTAPLTSKCSPARSFARRSKI